MAGDLDDATGRVLQLAHDSLTTGDTAKAERLMRLLEPQPMAGSVGAHKM